VEYKLISVPLMIVLLAVYIGYVEITPRPLQRLIMWSINGSKSTPHEATAAPHTKMIGLGVMPPSRRAMCVARNTTALHPQYYRVQSSSRCSLCPTLLRISSWRNIPESLPLTTIPSLLHAVFSHYFHSIDLQEYFF